ncbi:hypothetical protein ACHAQE_001122 [Botrytis cinerea]
MQRKIFVLLFLASRADADGTDVTNNLFSDLGPLLALFGESFAQQFLRESFTWLDHIIFAMAPLGIITAIIGAIRVGGPPQLKALIGRARENRASAELDFMSSTSHEVSELWNGHGIVRTMGKGKVKQILFLEGRGPPEKFGLFTLIDAEKDNLITRKAYSDPHIDIIKELWRKKTQNLGEKTSVSKSPNNDSYNNMSGRINPKEDHVKNDGLDRAPNISLNIHPKQNRGELFAAAVLGFILQVGVIIFSAFVAYDTRFGAAVGGHPSTYAFPTLASGTAVLVFGMGVCALVIGESTDESVWELKADGIVSTLQGKQNHQSELKVPSGDVEAGGANHSHNSHKHLWKRIIGVFAKTPMKEGERKTKFLSEILKSNAKKCDSGNRKFRVFWLQQRFVVSDQTFDSYMLMARMEKELIMTSCRSDNRSLGTNYSRSTTEDSLHKTRTSQMRTLQIESPNTVSNGSARSPHIRSRMSKAQKPPISPKQMPPYESTSKWINTLCIIGTSTGIIGFILQFEGFRGISWACSIAQLVAILIMTVVRAIIRRGMLDRPIAQKIPEKYEIDWLALRIGNDDKYLSDLSESTDKDDKKALDVAVEMEQKMQRSDSSKAPSHLVDVSGGGLESEHRGNPDNSNGKVDVNGKAKNPRKAGETEIPSKEEQLASAIKSLLRKENLTVDGGDLLLRTVEEKQKTPFEFLIDWKEIAFDMSQLDSANGRSILHLAVHAKSDMMVDRILKRWKPSNSSPPSQSLLFIDLADRRGLTALMLAASQGYEPGVKKLLAAGVKKDLRDINGRTALSWGAESGRLDILTQLIESDVTLKNEPMTKNSPLFIAVQNGKHEATELFLAKGADSNEVDDGGDSVLCDAVIFGHKECVQVLTDHGAKLEKESGMYKQTALSFAAKNGNLEIVKLLLNSGARLEAQDTDGWTPLIWALRSEHPKVVKFLIGEEVRSVSSKDQYMEQLNPAMTLACNTGDEDLVEQLLVLGVNPNAKDVDSGSTALIEASRGGLLRSETPLLLAVRYDNEVVTELLLAKGADANAESNTDETPLILATRNRNDDVTKLLLEKKADVDKANNSNETPLSLAVIDRNVDIIKLLLNNGASVDQAWGKYEQTCLLQAIYVEDEELVLLLLESGARSEREQKYTRNALQEAIWWRAENIVDHLLSFGASAGLKDTQGRSAFQFAAQIGALSSLKKLFEERPKEFNLLESTSHDKQDRDLIHHAFASGSMDMISYLIDRFSPNKYNYRRKDSDGWTPLHWAAQTGDLKVVQRLLEPDVGLDARVRELLKNWTPRQIASYNNHNEIVEFLEPFSIPDEVLPSAGFSHESVLCDGCNCKFTSDVTHPNHEFDEIGPGRETEPTQEVSPQQEIGLQQDGSSSEECSIHEDSNQDDAASQTVN